jgi:two-component system NarL family sensor kinase
LHPPLLDDLGLESAVRNYLPGFEKRTGIKTELEASAERSRRPSELETTAFRFLQEALANVQRHSGATRVAIRIAENDDRLEVSVEDNGRGFPASPDAGDRTAQYGGLGIAGIQERTRGLGGSFSIQSSEKGSTVSIAVPLHDR